MRFLNVSKPWLWGSWNIMDYSPYYSVSVSNDPKHDTKESVQVKGYCRCPTVSISMLSCFLDWSRFKISLESEIFLSYFFSQSVMINRCTFLTQSMRTCEKCCSPPSQATPLYSASKVRHGRASQKMPKQRQLQLRIHWDGQKYPPRLEGT